MPREKFYSTGCMCGSRESCSSCLGDDNTSYQAGYNEAMNDVKEDLDLLNALKSVGVDNWIGWDYAHKLLRGEEI